ncbi:hypothetical protein TSUD_308170 [Trifolium subterraneum]|nr:hypothetical protein TSUD_308170 [Trifolium subterraneum]
MAYSKKHSFLLISTLFMILQLQFSSAKAAIRWLLAKSSSVQTLLSIGGGGGSALAQKFANMASQASSRKSFIDSSIQLARDNNFNGLDLDWEYPSSDTDKTNYGLLITEWRAAVAKEASSSGNSELLLSAAVGGSDQITPLHYPTMTQPPAPLKNPTGQFSAEEATQGLGVVKYKDIINVGAQVVYNSTRVTNYCFTGTDCFSNMGERASNGV